MLRYLKYKIIRFFTGISFRILFFNVLLVFLSISSFLSINSYEHQMLADLEMSLAQQSRFLAYELAWKGQLTDDLVQRFIEAHLWPFHNFIQVFDTKGKLVYETKKTNWDIGPNPGDIRERKLYSLAETIFAVVTGKNEDNNKKIPSKPKTSGEIEKALQGMPTIIIKRDYAEAVPVVLISAFPIREDKRITGVVRIHRSANHILYVVYQFRWEAIRIILMFIVIAVILNIILARTILSPIKRLTRNAQALYHGKFNQKETGFKPSSGHDEIALLSNALVQLTDELNKEIVLNKEFVDDLVHELKNPLAGIRSASEMVESAKKDRDQKRFLTMIANDVQRMENLLSNVKDLCHIKSGTKEKVTSPIDIIKLTKKYVEYLELLKSPPVIFKHTVEKNLMVSIGEDRYIELIDNLVQNAFSFTKNNEPVEIDIKKEYHSAIIEIKDQGRGIPQIHLDKIFQRFYSVRSNDERKKHTGLGLSIVKSIVENNNGRILVSNRIPNGTCFRIELPYHYPH